MNAAASGDTVVAADELRAFTAAVFERAGMTSQHAGRVAEVLVWADLRGLDTHGVSRIPMYLRLLSNGDMNPRPEIATLRDIGASVLIEGDRGAGPVVMTQALVAATAKARAAGIGMALARRTTHTAALGFYTQAAAREGMACIAMAVSSPNMAYHGARAAAVSTSPLSIAVPGGPEGPIVFDMSTGVISLGRLMQAAREGIAIPPGSAIDKSGNPTTDGARAHVPLPMGGPKGSGIALMLELLVSLVASNPLLAESLEGTVEGKRHRQNGMVIVIDLSKFGDPAAFSTEARRLAGAIRSLPADPDAGGVRLPGERGDATQARRLREGIPLSAALWKELAQSAARFGVPMPG
jgi:ureidoglycolate dehydrogenase (NAD+)